MSIKHDIGLIEKYKEIEDVGSMKVTIKHDQVCEIVVADLIAKYKACRKRGDVFEDSFAQVLKFYLTDDEFNEIDEI